MRKAKSQRQTIRDFFERDLPRDVEERNHMEESLFYWWVIDNKKKIAAILPGELIVVIADSCPPETTLT